ncbi:hypothetical protein QR680_003646 [Steinernema hermaphroditum]|uniref:Uncharacterized protein n=1 Tax=Steinernema hermaphroditum TaxID=289476 RepID=A0AA39HNB0_9BILA|nr:hypothetical protein QR680_003644 [Steinernema hermaphroditum]KAK0407874.1 hypothetical protein QR680_003646 [Steinernema hermaphroditum]
MRPRKKTKLPPSLAVLPNDFARLPTDVVHEIFHLFSDIYDDVCEFIRYSRRHDEYTPEDFRTKRVFKGIFSNFGKFLTFDGPWGAVARTFSACTCNPIYYTADREMFDWSVDDKRNLIGKQITVERISKQIRKANICFPVKKKLAKHLCNSIKISQASHAFLQHLRNRFQNIEWSAPVDNHAIDFLKRVMDTRYLRTLKIASMDLSFDDLGDSVSRFVQRPNFEHLGVSSKSIFPFEALEALYTSWINRKFFEVPKHEIRSFFDDEFYERLTVFIQGKLHSRLMQKSGLRVIFPHLVWHRATIAVQFTGDQLTIEVMNRME